MDNFDAIERTFAEKIGPVSKCPPPEMLLAHREGVLPEEAELAIAKHLERCQLCPILLEDLDSIGQENLTQQEDKSIRKRVPGLAPKTSVKQWQFYVGAVAACLVIAVGIMFSFKHLGTGNGEKKTSTAQQELASLPIEKLPPQSAGPDIVFRGEASSTEPTFSELEPAFDAYQKNDYKNSAARFGELVQQFPKSDIPILYLGISQLFLSQNEAALQSLVQADAIAQPERKDTTAWYRAVAATRSHAPEAKALLQSVCQNHASIYSQKACAALSTFDPVH